jgi:hypothetical protein
VFSKTERARPRAQQWTFDRGFPTISSGLFAEHGCARGRARSGNGRLPILKSRPSFLLVLVLGLVLLYAAIMFLATTNKTRRLLYLSYVDLVTVAELERGYAEVVALLADFPAGFQTLADMSRMESMEVACAEILGQTMELLEQQGVEMVVRVIPDSSKDIGLNIISIFHYQNQPRIVTCQTMSEAARALAW